MSRIAEKLANMEHLVKGARTIWKELQNETKKGSEGNLADRLGEDDVHAVADNFEALLDNIVALKKQEKDVVMQEEIEQLREKNEEGAL